MNQIELVTGLPNWKWKENSLREMEVTGEQLVGMSDFVWRVGSVATAGFIYYSYTSPPWMWFVLADKVTISDLVDFRRVSEFIPEGTQTAVRANFEMGLRFAKLYGFKETGEEHIYYDDLYKVMVKK